jgi:hypothetical protein
MTDILYSTGPVQYIAFTIISFLLGAFIGKLFGGPSFKAMREEEEKLKVRLMEAERLLSERTERLWGNLRSLGKGLGSQSDSHLETWDHRNRADMLDIANQYADEPIEDTPQEGEELEETIIYSSIPEADPLSELSAKRKVQVKKLAGVDTKIKTLTSFVGLEEERPVLGKKYRVFIENGKVFKSSPVTDITGNFIRTKNSIYEINVLLPNGMIS